MAGRTSSRLEVSCAHTLLLASADSTTDNHNLLTSLFMSGPRLTTRCLHEESQPDYKQNCRSLCGFLKQGPR